MPQFALRPLTPDDAAIVARHRAAMFCEMGSLAVDDRDALVAASTTYLETAIAEGEYHGWLASIDGDDPGVIVGGAGIQLRTLLPRPDPKGRGLLAGRQGLILNVFVEPAFRRHGLARRLVQAVLEWARGERLASVVLHASEAGRPLYEQLGFVSTNEMRFTGPLVELGVDGV